jgi:hypothetical protein
MSKDNIIVGFSKVSTIGVGLITVSAYGAAKGAGTNLGLSDGGIDVGYKVTTYPIEVDNALGEIDEFKTKESLQLKFGIAEASAANLALAMGYPSTAVVAGTATFGGDWTVTKYTVYIDVNGPGGGVRSYTFILCTILGDVSHKYTKNGKTMIPFTVNVLQDLTATAKQQLFTVVDASLDTTAPTIAMTTPTAGGTVVKTTKNTVLLTITEANNMDVSTIVYGNTISILDITTPASPTLVAGTIAYDAVAKTVTFTPTSNWATTHTYEVVVTTGLKDQAGNALATTFVGEFTSTS